MLLSLLFLLPLHFTSTDVQNLIVYFKLLFVDKTKIAVKTGASGCVYNFTLITNISEWSLHLYQCHLTQFCIYCRSAYFCLFIIPGRSVFTTKDFVRNEFLLIYHEELISNTEANKRESTEETGFRYFFTWKGQNLW